MKTLLKDRALRKLQWHLQVTICCFSTEFLIDHYVRTLETTVCRCTPGCGWCSTRYRCSLCYTYQYSRGVELQLHQFANGMSWTSIDPPLNFDLWPHFGKVSSCPEPARHFLVTTAHHAELRSQFRGEHVTLTTTILQGTDASPDYSDIAHNRGNQPKPFRSLQFPFEGCPCIGTGTGYYYYSELVTKQLVQTSATYNSPPTR